MKRVRKAIIPAAGLGTRFLPATKAMPKEMLPIVDKPTIQYIIEEAVASGIEDIIIVTGKGKRAIEDHFDFAPELEQDLIEKNKTDLLEKVRYSTNLADIHYIRQKEPKGLGHAVWCARNFIGDEPFAVLLGDDIVQSETPCLKQLINVYDETYSSVIGVQTVPNDETYRYGIVEPSVKEGSMYQVKNLVEKPKPGTSPSNLAIMGRYILTPEMFMYLEQQEPGAGGEIQLTDAIQKLNQIQRVFAYDFEGKRFDVGEKIGFVKTTIEFVKTTIEFALQEPSLRKEILSFMDEILEAERLNNI
ncbi:UTP--glucose-1-phosphate uridylyltransferase GalU [Bacillus sp. S3]|uniref:UTP--glucose-1-phosphate uridylyltransferase GalU n=1 Tax=Bacillus sp. S3 TaxID=486398 RepID=UPI001189BE8F|nr:UTP--glucose-1-phosphate uridylyltransferase GalU [Bacillus sp. S3]QCJ44767.1 UTP--glucose-1-phosphate uridylyltransferase GalU [Bacillus sp. S3]